MAIETPRTGSSNKLQTGTARISANEAITTPDIPVSSSKTKAIETSRTGSTISTETAEVGGVSGSVTSSSTTSAVKAPRALTTSTLPIETPALADDTVSTSSASGTTGSLGMSDATYARSASGMKNLISVLQSEIDRTVNYLSGSEYTTMINTLSKYWIGVDADNFKKQLQSMLNQDAQAFKSYKSLIQNAIDADSKFFDSTQSKIASSINA